MDVGQPGSPSLSPGMETHGGWNSIEQVNLVYMVMG